VKAFRKNTKQRSKRIVKKMTSEFCISSSLHHPHVVETLDLVVDNNHNWCEVMEYCAGGTLFDVLKDRKLLIGEVNCCYNSIAGSSLPSFNGCCSSGLEALKTSFLTLKDSSRSVTSNRSGCVQDCF